MRAIASHSPMSLGARRERLSLRGKKNVLRLAAAVGPEVDLLRSGELSHAKSTVCRNAGRLSLPSRAHVPYKCIRATCSLINAMTHPYWTTRTLRIALDVFWLYPGHTLAIPWPHPGHTLAVRPTSRDSTFAERLQCIARGVEL